MRLCTACSRRPRAAICLGRGAANSARGQAMVFQRPVMLRRSALANVVYALKLAGNPGGSASCGAHDALEAVGLAHARASPGARALGRRAAAARARARLGAASRRCCSSTSPPRTSIPGATREIESIIAPIDARGTKIVMTTHNLGQARRLGDEVMFLHQGRVVERAPVDDSFRNPRRRRPRRSSKENFHGTDVEDSCSALVGACARALRASVAGADNSSPSPRPPRPSSRACSSTCCRSSRRRPASRCASWRSAPGQALDMGRRGDADVVFVHARPLRRNSSPRATACSAAGDVQRFRAGRAEVGPGQGRRRQGRRRGAAQDQGRESAVRFARRPQRHALRRARAVEGRRASTSTRRRAWYRETGQGMGPALNTASAMNAYVLADRGTWLSFKNRGDSRSWSRATSGCSTSTA